MKSFSHMYSCIYIHSAGVGRTGTYITLDTMMERLKERDDLNIFEFVNEMRTQRMKMVQTLVSRISSDAYSVTCITLLKFNIYSISTPLIYSNSTLTYKFNILYTTLTNSYLGYSHASATF